MLHNTKDNYFWKNLGPIPVELIFKLILRPLKLQSSVLLITDRYCHYRTNNCTVGPRYEGLIK